MMIEDNYTSEVKTLRKRKIIAGILIFSLLIAVAVVKITDYNNVLREQRKIGHDLELKVHMLQMEQTGLVNHLQTLEEKSDTLQSKNEKLQEDKRSLQEKVDQLEKQVEQERANQWQSFKATYYDADYQSTGKSPGDHGYGITASGRHVQAGVTVSVDPKVIPLGSWIEILYPNGKVERRRADDTGRLIKGKHLDIYIPKASNTSGNPTVKVRIISGQKTAV
ncbi:hypothetical protein GZH47_33140 (plasmid) [Paenibacillus rhizovicinus]|uniref:3D domain-containing protein n=1 Tax=Paenibacillus rhizovicinus TaxID=2704463 RepID=A0A6C0PAY5_9BACL|nr:3D domain-containing protein [Paenibacillus rhizovicinus]QHW35740.1 hypothetical protein GZH47_33140 [Paenibacillus rhizovicinus]